MPDPSDTPRRGNGFSIWIKGGVWYVGFKHGGKHIQRSLRLRADIPTDIVEATASECVQAVRGASAQRAEAGKAPSIIDRYLESLSHRAPGTLENARVAVEQLRAFFGPSVNPIRLSTGDVTRWAAYLLTEHPLRCPLKGRTKGLSPMSARTRLVWLGSLCKFAGRPGILKGVRLPRVSHEDRQRDFKCFTADELQRLLDLARAERPEFYNALVFFAFTGCRVGELMSIRETSLEHGPQTVSVVGKGDKMRTLTLSGPMQAAWDALLRQIATPREYAPYLFPRHRGWSNNRLFPMCDKLGIKRKSIHKIRHSFVSIMAQDPDRAWNIFAVAKWVGHSKIDTTFRIYGHLFPDAPPSGPGFKV